MKKFFKNNLKTILAVGATAVICISGSVFATLQYQANSVSYTTAKNGSIKNVEEALNDLYGKIKDTTSDILWENSNPTSNFESQTINLNLNAYKGVIIIGKYAISSDSNAKILSCKYFMIGETSDLEIIRNLSSNDITYRTITVSNTGVEVGNGYNKSISPTNGWNNVRAIPTCIIGVK